MKPFYRGKKEDYIRNYNPKIVKDYLKNKGITLRTISRIIGRSNSYCSEVLAKHDPMHNRFADALEALGLPRDKYIISEPITMPLPAELTLLSADEQPAGGAVNNQNTDLYEIIKKAMYDALAAYFGKEQ